MNTVIVYDIPSDRRRLRLHKFLKDLGIPSQKSVFECRLGPHELRKIRQYCRDNLEPEEDSVRIYCVCKHCASKVSLQGSGLTLSELDWVVT